MLWLLISSSVAYVVIFLLSDPPVEFVQRMFILVFVLEVHNIPSQFVI